MVFIVLCLSAPLGALRVVSGVPRKAPTLQNLAWVRVTMPAQAMTPWCVVDTSLSPPTTSVRHAGDALEMNEAASCTHTLYTLYRK